MQPALAIHGGAWAIPDAEVAEHLDAMRQAVELGRDRLERAAGALDVVAAVIRLLEDHPALDAGLGAVLNQAGQVQLDAGIMDGESGGFGAVAGVTRTRHPIDAARAVLELGGGQASLLVGPGADRWAQEHGLEMVEPGYFVVPREVARFQSLQEQAGRFHTSFAFRGDKPRGTVGCVALDRAGRIATGTSTGGAPFTVPGRVGDSPLPGCGYWASSAAGASATGWGEAISRVLMCAHAVGRAEEGLHAQEAAEKAVSRLASKVRDPEGRPATGGVIVVDQRGRVGHCFNTPRMARASWTPAAGVLLAC
ncbi:MAG: isoaspartyl peptidase/L-asparaginase [Deltaproteobacteria bacterium]|nr:isoaspartyl peptidase/L-asparaginase [Deltaproteobacteria bacterium]